MTMTQYMRIYFSISGILSIIYVISFLFFFFNSSFTPNTLIYSLIMIFIGLAYGILLICPQELLAKRIYHLTFCIYLFVLISTIIVVLRRILNFNISHNFRIEDFLIDLFLFVVPSFFGLQMLLRNRKSL